MLASCKMHLVLKVLMMQHILIRSVNWLPSSFRPVRLTYEAGVLLHLSVM